MRIEETSLPGVLQIEPKVFGDERGFFLETWNARRYADAGLDINFVQDNLSRSRRGTLRGLHYQDPNPQGKLVWVLEGEVFEQQLVAIGLGELVGSPSFGRWVGAELSAENKRQMFVPEGFAHGFVVTSETALFHYKCTDFYAPQHERALRWNDPDLAIDWPLEGDPILSEKDANAPLLRELTGG